MNKEPMLDDELISRIEAALDTSNEVLDAISGVEETAALEGALWTDVLALKDRIEGLTIFKKDGHIGVKQLAERLEPVILRATKVYEVHDEAWDINPPGEQTVVDPYGLAAIALRSRLRDLASRLASIQNLLEAERIAAELRGRGI